jgi:hypothetical protein
LNEATVPPQPSGETDAEFLRRLLIEPSPGRAAVLLAHLGILQHDLEEGHTETLGARTFDAASGRLSLQLADGRIVELELVSHPDSEEGFAVNIRSRAGQLATHGFLRIDRDSGVGPHQHRMVYLAAAREAHDAQIYASTPYDEEGEVEYLDPPPDQPVSEFIPDAHVEVHPEPHADDYPDIHFTDPVVASRFAAPAAFEPEEADPDETEPEEPELVEKVSEPGESEPLQTDSALEPPIHVEAEAEAQEAAPEPAAPEVQDALPNSSLVPDLSNSGGVQLEVAELAGPELILAEPETVTAEPTAVEHQEPEPAAAEQMQPQAVEFEPFEPEGAEPELPAEPAESLPEDQEPHDTAEEVEPRPTETLQLEPHEAGPAQSEDTEEQAVPAPLQPEPDAVAISETEPEAQAVASQEPSPQEPSPQEPAPQEPAAQEPSPQEPAPQEPDPEAIALQELEAQEPEPHGEPVSLDPQDLELTPPEPVVTYASANLRARYYAPLHGAFTPDQAELFDWVAETDTIQTYEHRGTLRYLHIDSETGQFYNQRREPVTRESALLHVMPPPPPIELPAIEPAPRSSETTVAHTEPPLDLKLAIQEKKVQKPTRFALQVDPPPDPNPHEPVLDAFTRKHSQRDEREGWRNRIADLSRSWRTGRNGQKNPEDQ